MTDDFLEAVREAANVRSFQELHQECGRANRRPTYDDAAQGDGSKTKFRA